MRQEESSSELSEFKVRRGKTLRKEERKSGERIEVEGRREGGKQVGEQCHPWRQSKLEASIGYTEKS